VVTVINSFAQNKFTQTLELIRRRNQKPEEAEADNDSVAETGGTENQQAETRSSNPGLPGTHPRAAGDLNNKPSAQELRNRNRESQASPPPEEQTGTGTNVPGSGSGPISA